ncbi:unnamed protein product [Prorocentrum cordatum]|uniref:Peptidase A1 domain-containing protein n=1 Tax=Prorocentrum cordatum TaxID=2364126 RepID=A0ABN9RS34_9DINO|nr:unnamed protein product [Polarella glacialis]
MVRAQFSKGVGIFGCDSWAVYAPGRTRLGPGSRNSSQIPLPPSGWGPPVPWLSRPAGSGDDLDVLMSVWQSVVREGHAKKQRWTVKADLDAVFFPSWLRSQLASTGGEGGGTDAPALYLRSCKRPADGSAPPPGGELSGALKAMARGLWLALLAAPAGVSGMAVARARSGAHDLQKAERPQSYRQLLHSYKDLQYYGSMTIGGQNLQVVMDTGSVDFVVLSNKCTQWCGDRTHFDAGI